MTSSYTAQPNYLPILLICFKRPENLMELLSKPEIRKRRVYIFIDGVDENESELNISVQRIANNYNKQHPNRVHISKTNLGVGRSVPYGINWVFQYEEHCIIMEDDCFPALGLLELMDSSIELVQSEVVMVCGDSPWISNCTTDNIQFVSSSYPLIWGWATTKKAWDRIRPNSISLSECVSLFYPPKNMKKLRAGSFFLSAILRTRVGTLKAWDVVVAGRMLSQGLSGLVPTTCLVSNKGNDLVSSHFDSRSTFERTARYSQADYLKSGIEYVDSQIESEIYGMRWIHILSLPKFVIELLLNPRKIKTLIVDK